MRGHDASPALTLSRAALASRAAHAVIAAEQLLAIAYVWWCALSGRRGRLLRVAAAGLTLLVASGNLEASGPA
jgi:hypothetical protein